MELVSSAQGVVRSVAEHASGCRLGQAVLRHLDRALWVVEKCARWAVPTPHQDDRPQPELIRPLPWVLFLALLLTLRVARESISLINLVLGKPPLRSADVVMYIQSKRRYLRTLKYQGSRAMRARPSPQPREPWYRGVQALFEFTMCFRRSQHYGNNNTTRVSNNDEVLVVKRSKRVRESASPGTNETAMERLIEKMMADLDAESDDDSSFTLTNATSMKSEDFESDPDTLENDETIIDDDKLQSVNIDNNISDKDEVTPTPTKVHEGNGQAALLLQENNKPAEEYTPARENAGNKDFSTPLKTFDGTQDYHTPAESEEEYSSPIAKLEDFKTEQENGDRNATKATEGPTKKVMSPKEMSMNFINSEKCQPMKQQPSKILKIANGRVNSASNKKKGLQTRRREEAAEVTISPSDDSV